MHQLYYSGLLQQVQDTRDGKLCSYTIQQYLDLRVRTIGVYPAIALTEFSEGVTALPERILKHPSLQECMRVCAELVVLQVNQQLPPNEIPSALMSRPSPALTISRRSRRML